MRKKPRNPAMGAPAALRLRGKGGAAASHSGTPLQTSGAVLANDRRVPLLATLARGHTVVVEAVRDGLQEVASSALALHSAHH